MYDTLIIGAGLSGLAAGIRLAYYDQKVCVLERHTTIGGLNSFYRLRGRNYDVGLHAMTNYAPPGTKKGPLSKLLRQLRLSWDDFDLCPQLQSAIDFPGHRLHFTNNFEVLREEIRMVFPQHIDDFDRLTKRIMEFDELNLNQAAVSAREVVSSEIPNPLLVDMLFCPLMFYGSARPDDMDFNQFVIMFKSIFMEGFARPFDGVRPIMKAVTRQFKANGGELKLRAGVQEILVEDGRAIGVRLDSGEELFAKKILSSAGSAETMRMCPAIPTPETGYAPGEISFCETIYMLNKLPADLGHKSTIVFYNREEKFHYAPPTEPCDLRSGIICSPNNFQYEDGQQHDEGCMRITALANPDYWFQLTPEAYNPAKEHWEKQIYNASLPYIPDFRPLIQDIDIFTPKTIKRFTGHINGCVYGAPDKLLTGQTPVKNLYVCGTDQGFLGIVGSMLSGITMANNHCLT
jgi:phytoene dehydrogenase-like protein